eukprot:135382_1
MMSNRPELNAFTRYSIHRIACLSFNCDLDSFTLLSQESSNKFKCIMFDSPCAADRSFTVRTCEPRNALKLLVTSFTVISTHWYRKNNEPNYYHCGHVNGFNDILNIIEKYSDTNLFAELRIGSSFNYNGHKCCVLRNVSWHQQPEIIATSNNNSIIFLYPLSGFNSVFVASVRRTQKYNELGKIYNKLHNYLFYELDKAEFIGAKEFTDWFSISDESYSFK